MPNYCLHVRFNENDLRTIQQANQKVVIAKHTAGNAEFQVAWISFRPFMENTIEWSNDFAMYASTTEIENGATINMLSYKEVETKVQYQFKDGIFQNATPQADLDDKTYSISNQMNDYARLTFGLAQSVIVNGEAFVNLPINAFYLHYGQNVKITPTEKISVYLKADVGEGTIINLITSIAMPIEYTESEIDLTIMYDGSKCEFIPIK